MRFLLPFFVLLVVSFAKPIVDSSVKAEIYREFKEFEPHINQVRDAMSTIPYWQRRQVKTIVQYLLNPYIPREDKEQSFASENLDNDQTLKLEETLDMVDLAKKELKKVSPQFEKSFWNLAKSVADPNFWMKTNAEICDILSEFIMEAMEEDENVIDRLLKMFEEDFGGALQRLHKEMPSKKIHRDEDAIVITPGIPKLNLNPYFNF